MPCRPWQRTLDFVERFQQCGAQWVPGRDKGVQRDLDAPVPLQPPALAHPTPRYHNTIQAHRRTGTHRHANIKPSRAHGVWPRAGRTPACSIALRKSQCAEAPLGTLAGKQPPPNKPSPAPPTPSGPTRHEHTQTLWLEALPPPVRCTGSQHLSCPAPPRSPRCSSSRCRTSCTRSRGDEVCVCVCGRWRDQGHEPQQKRATDISDERNAARPA